MPRSIPHAQREQVIVENLHDQMKRFGVPRKFKSIEAWFDYVLDPDPVDPEVKRPGASKR